MFSFKKEEKRKTLLLQFPTNDKWMTWRPKCQHPNEERLNSFPFGENILYRQCTPALSIFADAFQTRKQAKESWCMTKKDFLTRIHKVISLCDAKAEFQRAANYYCLSIDYKTDCIKICYIDDFNKATKTIKIDNLRLHEVSSWIRAAGFQYWSTNVASWKQKPCFWEELSLQMPDCLLKKPRKSCDKIHRVDTNSS